VVSTLPNVILIPNAAIQHSPQSDFVYVVKSDSTVEVRNVKTQGSERDQTAISQGLSAGEVVVTDGIDKLQPGAKVALSKSQEPGS
jgi:multidrug efflux system membrane fusion protein